MQLNTLQSLASSKIQRVDTEVLFALMLAGSMAIFVPLFGQVVLAKVIPVSLFFSVLLTITIFSSLVIYTGEYISGGIAALIVLPTFNANFPLTNTAQAFPGGIVGQIHLVYIPIGMLCSYIFYNKYKISSLSTPSWFLLMFVFWSILSAIFGGGVSVSAGLWFTMYIFMGLLVFSLIQIAIKFGWTSYSNVLGIVAISVTGHLIVALCQFSNQDTFGLTHLGGGAAQVIAVISLPVVGDAKLGHFVSGFTGTSYNLANLLVLITPFLAGLYLLSDRQHRYGYLVWIAISSFLIRLSGSDAARGAAIVSIVLFAVLVVFRNLVERISEKWIPDLPTQRIVGISLSFVSTLLILFIPSSRSGSSSVSKPTNANLDGTSSNSGSGGSSAGGHGGGQVGNGGGQAGEHGVIDAVIDSLTSLSVPFFDLSYIGVRIQQYIVSIDMFWANPLFGVGGRNYILVAADYGAQSRTDGITPVHNIYLTILSETGIVGFLLFFAVFILTFVYSVQLIWNEHPQKELIAAGATGLLGVLAFGFFDKLQLTSVTGFFPMIIVAGALVGEYLRFNGSNEKKGTVDGQQ